MEPNYNNSKMPQSCSNEIKDLFKSYEKSKHAEKQLTDFMRLLEKEIKLVKDDEVASDSKRNLYQKYASQQQEVLLKLFNVKDENTQLKQTLTTIDSKITDIQNKCMADYVMKDAEVDGIKEDFLTELIKIRDTTDDKLNQVKSRLNPKISELKSTLAEQSSVVKEQLEKMQSLQDEIITLKEKSAVNSELYQQKLSERRREHLAELETWKRAELNQMTTASTTGQFHSYEQVREMDGYHMNSYLPRNSYEELNSGPIRNSNFQNRRAPFYRLDPTASRHPLLHGSTSSEGLSLIRPPPQPLASQFQTADDFYGQHPNAVDQGTPAYFSNGPN